MKLLLQSKSTGEHLYPYLAALIAGHSRSKGEQLNFFDLNFCDTRILKTDQHMNYREIIIVISWISIGNFDKNINDLKKLIKSLTQTKSLILITSDNIKIIETLKRTSLGSRMKHLTELIPADEFESVISDYTKIKEDKYLSSIFSSSSTIPVLSSIHNILRKETIQRKTSSLIEDISYIKHKLNIETIALEDCSNIERPCISNFISAIEILNSGVDWLYLGGVNLEHLEELDIRRMKLSGCQLISININTLKVSDLHLVATVNSFNVNCVGYLELSNSMENYLLKLRFILISIFLKTSINHYYYLGKRRYALNTLCVLGYLLSFLNAIRLFRIFKNLYFKKTDIKKIILKMKRILS